MCLAESLQSIFHPPPPTSTCQRDHQSFTFNHLLFLFGTVSAVVISSCWNYQIHELTHWGCSLSLYFCWDQFMFNGPPPCPHMSLVALWESSLSWNKPTLQRMKGATVTHPHTHPLTQYTCKESLWRSNLWFPLSLCAYPEWRNSPRCNHPFWSHFAITPPDSAADSLPVNCQIIQPLTQLGARGWRVVKK